MSKNFIYLVNLSESVDGKQPPKRGFIRTEVENWLTLGLSFVRGCFYFALGWLMRGLRHWERVTLGVVLAALLGALVWNL